MPKSKPVEKKTKKTKDVKTKAQKVKKPRKSFKESYIEHRDKVWDRKRARLRLHHSFRRSYREDYRRELNAPGLVQHAWNTLKIVVKNWKLFLPLLVMVVAMNIVLVGLLSEDTYKTFQNTLDETYKSLQEGELGRFAKSGLLLISTVGTGGLTRGMNEVQQVFAVLLAALTWLVTIYYLRHLLAGNKPRFRDGIYNACTPLISSLLVIALIFIHLVPIFIFIIVYSAAITTGFLETPLYAFVFWLFGGLLLLLSAYLLPVSITSLVAVSVPGIYPMTAINASTDLLQGRRTKFIIRLIFAIIFLAVIWVIILLPLFWLDLFLKEHVAWLAGFPFASLCLQIMTTFTVIYITAYIYLFYRRMLDDPN